MPDGSVISSRSLGNVTPPFPGTGTGGALGAITGLWGSRGGFGPGAGFGLLSQRLARRKPGLDPVVDPELAGLTQAGPGGEVYDPERLFNIRGRDRSTGDRLGAMAGAARNYRGGLVGQRVGGSGFGVGGSDTMSMLKKILESKGPGGAY